MLYERFDRFNAASDKPYNVTVSVGTYLLEPGDTLSLEEALTRADEKLYVAKKQKNKNVSKL